MRMADGPAVQVTKLGYVGLQTQDLDRLVHHYTHVLDFVVTERDETEAYLTTTYDHHSLVIRRGAQAANRTFVGFQVAGDLDEAERSLREAGRAVQRRSDIAPSTPDVLVVEEPQTGTPLHLFAGQTHTEATSASPLRPTKLGHVAAYAPDIAALQAFYTGLLGFRWSDTVGDFFVFMRCNADHHAANFIASTKYAGMHHIAFEARDLAHLQLLIDGLSANGVPLEWGPGRHGPGHNVFTYHRDPDGNNVELFTQLDTMVEERLGYFEPRPWHHDHPQVPKIWALDLAMVNSWGPIDFGQIDH